MNANEIWGENRSQSLNVYAKSAENDFTAGVRFAEAEMKQTAQEFAEWIGRSGCYSSILDGWIHPNVPKLLTTPELYAIFEEINQQNNGG